MIMKPYKIEIYVYADTDEEAVKVQQSAINFVKDKYNKGILVTAKKISEALDKFKDSFMVNQYLK